MVQVPSSVRWRSLDDNFSGHLGVDRAEVGILAGLRERVGKLLVRIEDFGLERLFRLTTVCGMSSRLIHVTVVPTGTVTAAGPKTKLSIFTSVVEAVFSCALATKLLCSPTIPPRPTTAITSKLARNTVLLMISLPFLSFENQPSGLSLRSLSGSGQRRVHNGQRMLTAHVVHIRDAQRAAQLLGGHFHRPR